MDDPLSEVPPRKAIPVRDSDPKATPGYTQVHVHDKDEEDPPTSSRAESFLAKVRDWWILEILSLVVSLGSLVAIVAAFAKYVSPQPQHPRSYRLCELQRLSTNIGSDMTRSRSSFSREESRSTRTSPSLQPSPRPGSCSRS